MANRSHLSLL